MIEVRKEARQRWSWDCRRCDRYEQRRTWRIAFDEGLAHTSVHRNFGFQGGARRAPMLPTHP